MRRGSRAAGGQVFQACLCQWVAEMRCAAFDGLVSTSGVPDALSVPVSFAVQESTACAAARLVASVHQDHCGWSWVVGFAMAPEHNPSCCAGIGVGNASNGSVDPEEMDPGPSSLRQK